jgi:hypothetical protein
MAAVRLAVGYAKQGWQMSNSRVFSGIAANIQQAHRMLTAPTAGRADSGL